MQESNFCHFLPSGVINKVSGAAAAISAAKEGGFIWLNYFEPKREDLTALIDPLGIHPLSVDDCLDANQIPKIEHFPKNTFILFNAFSYANKTLSMDEVDLFIGENYLITVSGYNSEGRRPLDGIEQCVEHELENAKRGPAFLMHIILDHIVDRKIYAVDSIEDEIEEAEDALLTKTQAFSPVELIRLRRYLLNLRKCLFHEREILVKICRLDCPYITEKAIFHYRDIYDHIAKFLELTETNREIVTSLTELHTSLLNNQMAKASNQTNMSVRRLTLITTIFMPLTLLAGVGGMSEWSMMTGPANWKIAYPLFLLGMAVIGVINYYLIIRMEKKNRSQEKSLKCLPAPRRRRSQKSSV
jgi:magnesium transporter